MPHRFTRSRSKQENVEMLTEPLIYPSRKTQASPIKGVKRRSGKGYIKRTNSKATLNKTRTRSESAKSATQIETKSIVTRKRVERILEKSPGRRMSLRRRSKMEEEEENENEEEEEEEKEEKDADDNDEMKEKKKIEKKPTKSRRGQHLRKGARQKNKDIEKPQENECDLELEEMLQDVDEDDGSFDMIEDSIETGDTSRTKNHKMKNTKRLTSRENELNSPKCKNSFERGSFFYVDMTQFLNRDSKSIMSENEHIFKKIKIDEGFAHSSTKMGISYNSLKIKKIEGDLEKNLFKLSTRFQKKEKLREEDEESTQLSNITREFENNSFSGAEYISSDIGKIIKTIHFLLTKNTDLLHKTVRIEKENLIC